MPRSHLKSGLNPIVRQLEETLDISIRRMEMESSISGHRENCWIMELDHFLMKMIDEGRKIKPVYIANADEINSIPAHLRHLYQQS